MMAVLTNTGFAASAARLTVDSGDGGIAVGKFQWIGVGTDATAPAATQTALIAEITDSGLDRLTNGQDTVPTLTTTTETDDTSVIAVTFNVTGTKTVTEYGLFNASSAGVMLVRETDTALPLVSGDTLVVTFNIQHKA